MSDTATPTKFSHADLPWMKLGAITDKVLTAGEAADLVGMNWLVEKEPMFFGKTNKSVRRFPDQFVTVRQDTREPLSPVTKDYEVLQYREAFDFMDTVSPEFVAAGTLRGGKEGFMVVRHPDHSSLTILGDDSFEVFVILRTSHDRSRALEVLVMPVRDLCMNMLGMRSFGLKAEQRWSIRHVSTLQAKLAEAKDVLMRLDTYVEQFSDTAERLVSVDLELEEARKLLEMTMPDRPKRDDKVAAIMDIYENDPRGTVGAVGKGNGWGLLNATAEWFDHHRTGGSVTSESTFRGAVQGAQRRSIDRVATLLLAR